MAWVKACKINDSNGRRGSSRYRKFVYDKILEKGEFVNMTQAERDKVDNKTSALNMFSTRACKVNYDPELKD